MPARLPILLVVLAAIALGWLLFAGGFAGDDGALVDPELGFEDPDAAMRGADGPGLQADGTPRTRRPGAQPAHRTRSTSHSRCD